MAGVDFVEADQAVPQRADHEPRGGIDQPVAVDDRLDQIAGREGDGIVVAPAVDRVADALGPIAAEAAVPKISLSSRRMNRPPMENPPAQYGQCGCEAR